MFRSQCAVCESKTLTEICVQKQMPISISCSSQPFEEDRFENLHYGLCETCGCCQLLTLVDREILYKESHNNTFNTPTWARHHKEFMNFLLAHSSSKRFIEVGGSSGILAKSVKEYDASIEYTILDLCSANPNIEGVSFINANCEEFEYTNTSTLLLSHVFEHLYKPSQFIENIASANVQEVFLSIPNMEVSLRNSSLSFLHVEHTYYIDRELLEMMFQKHNYVCKNKMEFRDHSFFFHFVLSTASPTFTLQEECVENRKQMFHKYFKQRDLLYDKYIIQTKFFLVPSGHFGQFLYKLLSVSKENMLGFLDNDPSKIGKRLYGTNIPTYPMNEVKNYQGPITVVINAGPYCQEIKNQLLGYNPLIEFVDIAIIE